VPPVTRPLWELGAAEAAELLARGAITSEALVRACLARIEAEEARVQAWEYLDPELALAQARRIDAAGRPGPLCGLPVGVKDIVDTADMPTARGSPLFAGRRPEADAECVAALRRAGGVVLGKTVTTELAYFSPGKTRNPRDASRTPGGSSSGSAAAVAAAMVPAALGTQTAGSIIRPASFCGVVGYKPSHGLFSLAGVSPFAPSLDTLGVLVRRAADLPLLARALGARIEALPAARPPHLGLCRTEAWAAASPESVEAVEGAAAVLAAAGATVAEADGSPLEGLSRAQRTVMAFEAAASLADLRPHAGRLSAPLVALLREGEETTRQAYGEARARAHAARDRLPELFGRFDVLLTASAPGEAPEGLSSTGDPVMNRIWTLLGLPCVSLPSGTGPHGLPVGVQLVGPPAADAALLAAAAWAERALTP
jgi:amidase